MNLVGKILTALITIFSLCFLVIGMMVNASHQNWKDLAIANKDQVNRLLENKGRIVEASKKKDKALETEKVARMLRVQQLESQLALAKKDYEQLNANLAAERVKAETAFKIVDEAENRIKEQDTLIASQQEQLSVLTNDIGAQRTRVVNLTNQVFEAETRISELTSMRQDLVAENSLARKVMRANGLENTDGTEHIPRRIDGVITSVDEDTVALNVGLDDGLQNGHQVDFYREGGGFVGSAMVFNAQNNRSAARLIADLSRVPVQAGDRVTTKWVLDQK